MVSFFSELLLITCCKILADRHLLASWKLRIPDPGLPKRLDSSSSRKYLDSFAEIFVKIDLVALETIANVQTYRLD